VSDIPGFALVLALPRCARCHGLGRHVVCRSGEWSMCHCVARNVSRACIARLRREVHFHTPWLRCSGGGFEYSYPNAIYNADVMLTLRRTLSGIARAVFVRCAIEDKDWRVVCRELKLSRWNMFHILYAAEARFGREAGRVGLYPPRYYLSALYVSTGQIARATPPKRRCP
jgi:hypothetical protein